MDTRQEWSAIRSINFSGRGNRRRQLILRGPPSKNSSNINSKNSNSSSSKSNNNNSDRFSSSNSSSRHTQMKPLQLAAALTQLVVREGETSWR